MGICDRILLVIAGCRLVMTRHLAPVLGICILASGAFGQRVAILIPEKSVRDIEYAERLASGVQRPIRTLDLAQSAAAFRTLEIANPYNMTATESRTVSSMMGCEYFLVIRTGGLRRESFAKPEYFESFSVTYLVSGRTGLLVGWWLKTLEAADQAKADQKLLDSIDSSAMAIAERIRSAASTEANTPVIDIEVVPDEKSPASDGLKAPIPYRRIKPQYTSTAALYDVKATVDLQADVDLDGKIIATRIVRWAGFGLDESVDSAVRSMNWRPAMRNGKPLPMRILLRYNFTKIDNH
ncbi:MAG: hypothetical protein DMF63_06600 [Acidobacteria bacterium]|nr:MAG: hypothetical protein DMF63_06600 [Acidobacteriota bacterium]